MGEQTQVAPESNVQVTQALGLYRIVNDVIDGVIFAGNPAVVYPCAITITDANASGANGDYGSKSFSKNVDISLGYPAVNAGVTSTSCVLSSADAIDTNSMVIEIEGGVKSRIFYIGGDVPVDNLESIVEAGTTNLDFTNVKLNNGANEAAHSSGTLSFTFNIQQLNVGGNVSRFEIERVVFYYRFEGENEWISLNTSLEYNGIGDTTNTNSTGKDFPGENNLIIPADTDNADVKWLQTVRAFDYAAFALTSAGRSIQYAILVKNLKFNSGTTDQNQVYAWITADDLHYPACINRQGTNIAPQVYYANSGMLPAGNAGTHTEIYYEYFRSAASIDGSDSTGAAAVDFSLSLYAETPFGEYVNVFFNEQAKTTPYLPSSEAPYINFQLNQANYPLLQWQNYFTAGGNITLRWLAGFDSETGVKFRNGGIPAKAFQTAVYSGSPPGIQAIGGTTRLIITS